MRIGKIIALASVAGALGLAACGSSEFKAKVQAKCEAGGANGRYGVDKYDCACVADAFDSALDADQKTVYLIARVEGSGSASDVEKGLKKTGADPKADNEGFRAKLKSFIEAENAAEDKADASCKKS